MTTTTVIAKDTSSAMDDIMSKLGDDAVILSTKHKDGKVHMTATTENISTTPKRLKPSQQFSKIFESRMLNDQFLNQDKPLELEEAFNDTGASTAQLSALRSEIQEIKNMLSGVVVTEPQNLNDNIASTSALKLRQSGFSPKVVKRLEKSFLGKDYNDRINVGYARVSSHDQIFLGFNYISDIKHFQSRKKNNQRFYHLPIGKLIHYLEVKPPEYGVHTI